ncbi:unnamed protein product [Caenorhabditis sp. 36 PRJEB53466]|nr:unnamed protein product [Caenorhabditis sp. 36 PRJEB53466]
MSWTALPLEIRHEIIKKLEFRTRFRFRHVAKSTQIAVDSVPLHIPRVNFEAPSDDDVTITIFVGIEQKIKLEFAKTTEGVVEVKVSGHSIDFENIKKSVEMASPIHAALDTFKKVAMNPRTLLGGLELNTKTDRYSWMHTDRIFGVARCRTKILMLNKRLEDLAFQFHVAQSDLEEVQQVDDQPRSSFATVFYDGPGKLLTWTKRHRFVLGTLEAGKELYILNTYCTAGKDQSVADGSEALEIVAQLIGSKVIHHGPNDCSTVGKTNVMFTYTRWTSCGVLTRAMTSNCESQSPDGPEPCELRWACKKHADPFENWYQTKRVEHPNMNAQGLILNERIFPIVNGICPIKRNISTIGEMYQNWKDALKKEADEKVMAEKAEEAKMEVVSEKELEAQQAMCSPATPIASASSGKTSPNRKKLLLTFLRDLLDDETNAEIIVWTDRATREFKLLKPTQVAIKWGLQSGNTNMNYDKMSRALRYLYNKNNGCQKIPGKDYRYRFLEASFNNTSPDNSLPDIHVDGAATPRPLFNIASLLATSTSHSNSNSSTTPSRSLQTSPTSSSGSSGSPTSSAASAAAAAFNPLLGSLMVAQLAQNMLVEFNTFIAQFPQYAPLPIPIQFQLFSTYKTLQTQLQNQR